MLKRTIARLLAVARERKNVLGRMSTTFWFGGDARELVAVD